MKIEFRLVQVAAMTGVAAIAGIFVSVSLAQAPPPPDAPDVVHYSKLIPLLPEPPPGWTADEAEGSTSDAAGFTLTTVHRDYKKGEGDNTPTASISILDSAANPEYATATTVGWSSNTETPEGYGKSITIDGNPGFEAYENSDKSPDELKKLRNEQARLSSAPSRDEAALAEVNRKLQEAIRKGHGTLWLMIAKRYFLEVELQGQDPKELQEWVKRVDLKKLAEVK